MSGNASGALTRFTRSQRMQHWVMVAGFVGLSVTGIPQKYAAYPWGERALSLLGGIELVRVGHRVFAILLMIATIHHLIDALYRIGVLRRPLSMLPRYQDVVDGLQAVRYNLGLGKERPSMGRFTFEEKVEYWALVWGTVVMVATGFMLWNPIATARFLPGQWIPAAQVAHGGEAVLAILAVILWHGYGVHIRHFNRSMFTGRMSRAEMLHEHPLELEAIEKGLLPRAPDPPIVRRRMRVFVPVAAVVGLLLCAGLYWFVTFEQTAIGTLPPLR
jgi:cytochrome b subunit of formate dehydrogenase